MNSKLIGFTLAAFVAVSAFAADSQSPAVALKLTGLNGGVAPFAPTNDSFSAALRFKVEGRMDDVRTLRLLMSVGNGFNHGFRLLLMPDPKSTDYFPVLEIGVGPKVRAWALESKTAAVAPGKWCRLAATWDGATARLYADGREIAAAPYAGKYVPAVREVRTGVAGESYGVLSIPFVVDAASVWTRGISADEVRAFAPDAAKPDTAEFASAMRRMTAGETFAAAKIESWMTEPHDPIVLRALRRAFALALLESGDADRAVKERDAALAEIAKDKRLGVTAESFRDQFLDCAVVVGRSELALSELKAEFARLRKSNASHLPYAALRLMKAAERAGDSATAAEAKSVLLSCDLAAFPHLRAELGLAASFTAHGEPGASVSLATPAFGFHVAPDGDDAAPGTLERPFKSFVRARDAVRELKRAKGLPAGGVAVWAHGGTWRMAETLALGADDSGEPTKPIVWSAWKDETPILDGGVDVPLASGKPVTDAAALARLPAEARGHVLAFKIGTADSNIQTLEHSNTLLSPLPQYGYYVGRDNRLNGIGMAITDCYQDGELLTPARHPNAGWLRIDSATNDCVKCAALGDLTRWTREPDLAATGFWDNFWADLTTPVKRVNPADGTLAVETVVSERSSRLRVKLNKNQTFFLLNALCALDAPGEWFLDRAAATLYLWPLPTKHSNTQTLEHSNTRITLSSFSGLFVDAKKIHDVRIEGFTFRNGRGQGVSISDSRDCVFAGNAVRNFGATGMTAHRCERVTVRDNVFRTFGHGALEVSGGDRRTLAHSGCVVSNNEFADVENRRRTYAPHLHLAGAGIEASFNRFTDSPSSAMRLEGNDFFIVSNLVEDVLLESDDQGGVDIYFNASYFGNRYCFNVWKNVGRQSDTIPCGQAAVRFDGNISGQTVYGNRFVNCGKGHFGGVQSCGGRLHVIDNNLFVDCGRGMSINNYPTNFWFEKIRPSLVGPCLKDVCITNAPYATRYPGIANLLWTNQVNHLVRNVTVGATPLLVNPPADTVAYGNWHFPKMPDLARLARETTWRPIPEERDVGPRQTPLFRRASANGAR